MSEYEGKKRGICPFSEVDTFIKTNDCGMFQFCDCCDDYFKAYDKGRADEQLQSIEDAKKQATEYLNALDKAKEESYQQGAKDFAEWLANGCAFMRRLGEDDMHTVDELISEWQEGAGE